MLYFYRIQKKICAGKKEHNVLHRSFLNEVFHKMRISCKIGMNTYPPWELVTVRKSVKILFSSKAKKSRNAKSYI